MTTRTYSFILVVLSLLLGTGAQAAVLRLQGSNTVGADLAPALAVAWLKSMGYQVVAEERHSESSRIRAQDAAGDSVEIEIEALGSSTGFRGLGSNAADLAMSSRRIKDSEIQALAAMGPMTSSESELIAALDGIAVVVHEDNPVGALSKAQIRDIFTGAITDWQVVGGNPGPISLHVRDENSGTYDVFRSLALGSGNQVAEGAVSHEDNAVLSDAVASDPRAIGFVGLPFVRRSKAVAISDGQAPAIAPSRFTVATEDYALARRLYLYLPSNSPNVLAREFAVFALSAPGQEVVARSGFVSQNVFAVKVQPGEQYPAEVRGLAQDAERLSVNIRFDTDGVSLDNKARRDLDRVYAMLSEENRLKNWLMLFGFTANDGAPVLMNLDRSARVARLVATYLQDKKIRVYKTRGYGAVAPVASNDTELGREKNRRVEIWVQSALGAGQ